MKDSCEKLVGLGIFLPFQRKDLQKTAKEKTNSERPNPPRRRKYTEITQRRRRTNAPERLMTRQATVGDATEEIAA